MKVCVTKLQLRLAKRTLNPLVPSLMTLIALGTVVLAKRKKRQKKEKGNSVQERQRKMDNCPVWGQTAAAAAALQQPSSFLPRNLTNTLSPSALIIFVLHPNVHPLSLVFLRQTMVVVFMCHFYFVTLRSFLSQFCQIVLLFSLALSVVFYSFTINLLGHFWRMFFNKKYCLLLFQQ